MRESASSAGEAVLRLLAFANATSGLENVAELRGDGVSVTDARQNGRRVDVRVASETGAAWLIVAWFTDLTLAESESITVYPRPERFRGERGGLVIVLNGPSSAGKSTLMQTFADRCVTPFACLDEPFFGRLPARFLAWPETLGPHVEGVLVGLAAAARLGNQFVVSAAGTPQAAFEAALTDVKTLYVGLDAPLDVLVQRQLAQVDKFGGLAEESIGNHEGWRYDLRINTVDVTPETAAELLADLVRQRYGETP